MHGKGLAIVRQMLKRVKHSDMGTYTPRTFTTTSLPTGTIDECQHGDSADNVPLEVKGAREAERVETHICTTHAGHQDHHTRDEQSAKRI